jgi:hypothetical protein
MGYYRHINPNHPDDDEGMCEFKETLMHSLGLPIDIYAGALQGSAGTAVRANRIFPIGHIDTHIRLRRHTFHRGISLRPQDKRVMPLVEGKLQNDVVHLFENDIIYLLYYIGHWKVRQLGAKTKVGELYCEQVK